MNIEAHRKIIKLGANVAGQFAFPLLRHKLNSDGMGKHEEWTRKKHIILSTLAAIIDLGFNLQSAIFFLYGNPKEAELVKTVHVIGADAIPETLTSLKNKVVNNLANRQLS